MSTVDAKTMASTNPKVFFGGDAAFGPKNIIGAVAHGRLCAERCSTGAWDMQKYLIKMTDAERACQSRA